MRIAMEKKGGIILDFNILSTLFPRSSCGVENVNLEKYQTDDDLCKPSGGTLSTIDEDCGHVQED